MSILTDIYERNKKWLYFVLAATFLWGMLAMGYCFFDNNFSHDSLFEWNGPLNSYLPKVGRGRIFIQLYHGIFRGDVILPWLVGCTSLFWMGLAAFFAIKAFDVKSKVVAALISGILTTNISITAMAATFMHDLDVDTFALMCSVLAAYLWRMDRKWSIPLGALPVCLALGMYQTYLFTTITLVMILSVMDLLKGETFQRVFARGLKAVAMVVLGGILCYAAMTLTLKMYGIGLTTGGNHSLLSVLKMDMQELPALIFGAYKGWFTKLWDPFNMYPTPVQRISNLGLLVVIAIALGLAFSSKKLGLWEKVLTAVLVALMPLMMNIFYVLTLGKGHDLMVYGVWLTYLFALLLSEWILGQLKDHRILSGLAILQRHLCLLVVFFLLFGNVKYANGMYLKKDMEADAYLSLMTRAVARLEAEEDYIPGETPVVFVGIPGNGDLLYEVTPGLEIYQYIYGSSADVVAAQWRDRMEAYIVQVMGIPMNLTEDPLWSEIGASGEAAQMPCYPAKGCIAYQDGILVMKLGEV